MKTVNPPALSTQIAACLAGVYPDSLTGELVARYNTALSFSLDSLAPLRTRTVSFACPAPWFTTELRTMKATGRRLERLYKKTGLTVHHLAFKDHVKAYKEALSRTMTQYYSTLIGSQQRQLFSTINKLLSPPTAPHPSGATDLCSRFLDFFQEKVDTIHQQLLPQQNPGKSSRCPASSTHVQP